ncbi:MAG: hypothetical protein ABIW85_05750, partial [Variovorax sp.]
MKDAAALPTPSRVHLRRLRDVYRSAGWPCCDAIELDLLAAALLERVRAPDGHETVRLTDAGIALAAGALAVNRATLSRHEALVERVAREMTRSGRLAWRGLSLRAWLPRQPLKHAQSGAGVAAGDGNGDSDATATPTAHANSDAILAGAEPKSTAGVGRWCIARPDVFSIRNTSVEAYAQPVVHEIKVSRADLLTDLRNADKRHAYLDLGGECWYVLGDDALGRPIGDADEIPGECGVVIASGPTGDATLRTARAAVHRVRARLPFSVWMALAKAQP